MKRLIILLIIGFLAGCTFNLYPVGKEEQKETTPPSEGILPPVEDVIGGDPIEDGGGVGGFSKTISEIPRMATLADTVDLLTIHGVTGAAVWKKFYVNTLEDHLNIIDSVLVLDSLAAIRADVPYQAISRTELTDTSVAIRADISGGGASAINDLTDVTITSPSSTQVLKYNGSGWVNAADATGGGGSSSLYQLYAEDFYISDWSLAIQTAIDSLNGLGGGVLHIPPGTLLLNEKGNSPYNAGERFCIELKSGVHLKLNDATILKLADGQQTDANGPVNIIEFENIENASISGGSITGNTAGQTGWTGGYGQTTYGCIIKGASASLSGGNTNIVIENMALYDHFSNPITIEGFGFQVTNQFIRVQNIQTWGIGEGPSITGASNVIFRDIMVEDSTRVMAGDMTEIVSCLNFMVDNIVTVAMPGSTAASAIDIGGSANGRISGVRGYNIVNGISISDDSGGNPCKNVTIEDCYFQGIGGGGQYGIIVSDLTTDSIYINNVTTRKLAAGFLIGANGSLASTAYVVLNNCQSIDNTGQGIVYQSGRLIVNGGDYSGNVDGFVWDGRLYGNSGEIVINGAQFNDNSDYGINISSSGGGDPTALPEIKANISANNNLGTGGALNVNVLTTIAFADTVSYINNATEKYISTVSNPYVTGVKTLVYNNTSNLTTLQGGHHNQLVDVVFERAVSLIDGSGIETQSGISDSKAIGDIVTLRYDQPDLVWYEVGYNATGSGDNLGNHTATQNVILGASNWLSGDGDNEGLRVGATGNVGVGTAASYVLDIFGAVGDKFRIKDASYEMKMSSSDITTNNPLMRLGAQPAGAAIQMNNLTENYLLSLLGNKVGIRQETPAWTLHINGTDGMLIPSGTTAQRGPNTAGGIRHNTTTSKFEGFFNGGWRPLEHFLEVSTDRIQYQGGTYAYFMSPGELYHTSPTLGIGSNTAGRALYFNTPTANDVITIQGSSVGIGDNTPDALLDVAGDALISGVIYLNDAKTVGIFHGTGSPESVVTASVGSTFHRTDGGASTTLYVKESGTGNTGWVAK